LANTSGSGILAIGREAYKTGDTEGHNMAIGLQTMDTGVAGAEYNVAVGNFALKRITSGDNVVAVGYQAGTNITSGANSVFVGYDAGGDITTGEHNIFMGNASGNGFDTESHNLGIGTDALGGAIAGGEYNVAVGNYTLDALTSGDKNTGVGYHALGAMTEGNNNTAFGHKAGYQTTTGTHNTYLGESAGGNVTSGGENIFVGRTAGTDAVYNATNESNRLVLGINAITDAYIKVAFTVTSDARDKMNFEDVPHGLSFVNQLNPVKFHFKKSRDDETPHGNARYGFKAQDILALEGENNVIIDNENTENLKYKGEHLVPVLVKAVQELSAQVTTLQNEVNTLKGE